MTTLHKAAQAALEALEHCREVIVERGLNGNEEFAAKWSLTLPLESSAKAINDLRAALAQEPARQDWVGVPCLEKMRVTMTRLGLSTDESLEGFGARLEDNIYSMCRTVNRILDKLRAQPTVQEPAEASVAGVSIGSPLPDVCKVNTPDTDRAKALLEIFSNGPDVSVQGCLGGKEAPTAPESLEYVDGQWWVKELEGVFSASIGSAITADQKRAANVALNGLRALWADREAWVTEVVQEPAVQEPDCRIELVTAIHFLASDFENSLYKFGNDTEALQKAKGDIAHARSVAAKFNWNGTSTKPPKDWTPPYTHPAPQPKRLTDEQIDKCWRSVDYTQPYGDFRIAVGRAIESAVLGEKP